LIDFKNFPTTRYQGSKRKILPWIYEVLKDLRFRTVLDACGGSGSVSYLLKKMGKCVTYNDKLYFNSILGKALIENQEHKLTPEDLNFLNSENPQLIYPNFIQKNFESIYYLNDENKWLDMMVNNIANLHHPDTIALEYKKALAYYALFQSSMIKRPFNLFHRNNLNLRTNDVKRNFGNKTTWEGSFENYFLRFAEEANDLVFDSHKNCSSLNMSILDIDPYGYDLVYIDPPYIRKDGSNESSDYLKCYHFLEGLARYNEWGSMIDYNSINRRLNNLESQNDFKKQTICETIEEIIVKFKKNKIVFSYKKGGLPSIQFIVKKMREQGKRVTTRSMQYTYALNHQNGDADKNREVLIIGI